MTQTSNRERFVALLTRLTNLGLLRGRQSKASRWRALAEVQAATNGSFSVVLVHMKRRSPWIILAESSKAMEMPGGNF